MGRKIALIPARGNSKRFPKKNVALLGGKPLIEWTIEAAIESQVFDEIVLSSNNDATLEIGKNYSEHGLVLHKRDAQLSEDHVTASEVLKHLIQERNAQGCYFEQCAILLPTCPFRSAQDIIEADKLLDGSLESVVSMATLPVIPEFIFIQGDNGQAKRAFNEGDLIHQKTRKQDYPDRFYPNGAIYLSRVKPFLQHETFFSDAMKIYPMPSERSIDIDYQLDLHYAQTLLDTGVISCRQPVLSARRGA